MLLLQKYKEYFNKLSNGSILVGSDNGCLSIVNELLEQKKSVET